MKRSLILKKLESVLSEKIKNLYEERLTQPINKIYYHVFEQTIAIVIEGSVTQVERFLIDRDRASLAQQIRLAIDSNLCSQIKNSIEENLNVTVVDLLFDTSINTNRTGVIVVFEVISRSS
jgi:uncharacterized protein YbcI